MTQTSKSKPKTKQYTDKDKYNENKILTKTDKFKFHVGNRVIYHGGIYPELRGAVGTVVKCSSKIRVDYSVRFDSVDNGKIINCVLESVLTLAEENIENVDNIKENINEERESENESN
jgi:hypothetical protein